MKIYFVNKTTFFNHPFHDKAVVVSSCWYCWNKNGFAKLCRWQYEHKTTRKLRENWKWQKVWTDPCPPLLPISLQMAGHITDQQILNSFCHPYKDSWMLDNRFFHLFIYLCINCFSIQSVQLVFQIVFCRTENYKNLR